ncbi:MAG: formate dehydrogenase [Variovorax sp.]|nr:MAG: formate dehydrogenase [Variovorax sp.]
MHEPTGQLVRMANQIGTFFEAQTPADPAAATQAIAAHLKSFWAPSMRVQLVGQLDGGTATQLLPIVALAVQSHRATLLPHRDAG